MTVELADGDDEASIREEALARRVALERMSDFRPHDRRGPPVLVLGYAQIAEPAIRAGIDELAQAVEAARRREPRADRG